MGVGVGGLITQLMQGDPSAQLGRALAGPRPNPQPGAVGAGIPSEATAQASSSPGVNQPGQQLPPAQAYAPDPANASIMAQLLKVHQQDMLSNDINRNVQLMASGFGTAQQQHDMAALVNGAGMGGGDTLGALGDIQKLQIGQMALENKQRFQASADMLGQTFGLKPGQGAMLASDPELFNSIIATKVRDQSPTELQKNIGAYEAQARKAGIPEDQINSTIQAAFGGALTPGQTTDEKNMNSEIRQWKIDHPKGTREEMLKEQPQLESPSAYSTFKSERGKEANIIATSKATAKVDLTNLDSHVKPIADNLNQFFDENGKVKPEVITAIQSYDPPSEGIGGVMAGAASRAGFGGVGNLISTDPNVLNQKAAIAQLKDQLSADAMSRMKNIRNQREFTAIGNAASSVFDKRNSAEKIQSGMEKLRDQFNLTKANAIAAGGGEIPAEYADKVNKEYLEGGDLYNGATIAKSEGEAGTPPAPGAKKAPDGKWYVPDPSNPGKWMRVD